MCINLATIYDSSYSLQALPWRNIKLSHRLLVLQFRQAYHIQRYSWVRSTRLEISNILIYIFLHSVAAVINFFLELAAKVLEEP